MKKFLAGKKDNKGFSLVELIVVILIMGIIAVALAPQVMKWVGKSAKSTDESNAATIKSAVQVAIADHLASGNSFTGGETITYYVLNGGISSKKDSYTKAEGLGEKIAKTMGEFPKVKSESGKVFVITITADDSVTTSVKVELGEGTYGESVTPTP